MTLEEAEQALMVADDAHEAAEEAARRTDLLEDAAQTAWGRQPRYGQPGYDLVVQNAVKAAYEAAKAANDAAQRHARRLNYVAIDKAKLVRSLRINTRD